MSKRHGQHHRPRHAKSARRTAAERWGRWAEYWVSLVLMIKGYRVIARRYRCPFGEIDLIVRKNNIITFIEVKYRTKTSQQEAALPTMRSRRRLYKASQFFIARHGADADNDQQFAVVIVRKSLRLHWFHDLFWDFPHS